jgi:uncharacterized protein (TIGR02453 family)
MFPGIPKEGLAFLRALARNNNREWFQPRKEIFETKLKDPMEQLVEAINAELLKFAPEHITDSKKAVYRIYRDTRFSSDKTPYKTHIAANFPRHNLVKHAAAGYYFHIAPTQVGVAAGAWMPGPEELFAVRTWMTENYDAFRKLLKKAEKVIGPFHGSELARTPKGFSADHPAAELVRKKQWIYWQELDVKIATTPKLLPELVRRFRAAAPVVDALNRAISSRGAGSRAALRDF